MPETTPTPDSRTRARTRAGGGSEQRGGSAAATDAPWEGNVMSTDKHPNTSAAVAGARQALVDHLLALEAGEATIEEILAGPAAAVVVAEARSRIGDCSWQDLDPEEIPELPDDEVLAGAARHGVLPGVLADLQTCARHDPALFDHYLTGDHTGGESGGESGGHVPAPGGRSLTRRSRTWCGGRRWGAAGTGSGCCWP